MITCEIEVVPSGYVIVDDIFPFELNTSGEQQRFGSFDRPLVIGLAEPIDSITKPTNKW